MPRPRRCRRVRFEPNFTYFKPNGARSSDLAESILTVDELEALRLKDLLGLDQEEAAKKMSISQPTFHRIVLSARKKMADAVVSGKAIKIEGGNYSMVQSSPGRGMGRGFRGPAGVCKCPNCGYQKPKTRGVPCANEKCPKCGALMIRME